MACRGLWRNVCRGNEPLHFHFLASTAVHGTFVVRVADNAGEDHVAIGMSAVAEVAEAAVRRLYDVLACGTGHAIHGEQMTGTSPREAFSFHFTRSTKRTFGWLKKRGMGELSRARPRLTIVDEPLDSLYSPSPVPVRRHQHELHGEGRVAIRHSALASGMAFGPNLSRLFPTPP